MGSQYGALANASGCNKGVARILSGGALFFSEKVDDLFLVVALKTHTKTT